MHTTQYADGTAIELGSPYYSGTTVHNSNNLYSTTTAYYYTPYTNNDATPSGSDRPTRVQAWGYLYNWAAATRGGTDPQGICPDGWHIPTGSEWDALDTYAKANYGCASTYEGHANTGAAKSLCATTSWERTSPYPVSNVDCSPGKNQSGNDAAQFTAYPAGIYKPDKGYVLDSYDLEGRFVNFWSYDVYYYTAMGYKTPNLDKSTNAYKDFGFSVRCVKD